jgi:uncharacterized protein GlcG (DUF336 family)
VPELINVTGISLELALVAIDKAVAESTDIGCLTCVAVVDPAGHLVAFQRMDGAPFQSSKLAQDKAYSVAGNRKATHEFWEWIKDEPWLVHNVGQVEGLVVLGGGVPIVVGDRVVGAIGVSGQSDMEQDRAIAQAGADAVSAALGAL